MASARAATSPRPREQRYQTDGVTCPIGRVVNLSKTGMSLHGQGKPPIKANEVHQFVLRTGEKQLTVLGRVVWIRTSGLLTRSFSFGVQFLNLTPGVAAVIADLAQYGFVRPRKAKTVESAAAPVSEPAPEPVEAEMTTLYSILRIDRGASTEQIKEAYRRLALEHHPDVSTAKDAGETFALISKAYAVLKDPELRRKYDAVLARPPRAA